MVSLVFAETSNKLVTQTVKFNWANSNAINARHVQ
jgi:hypothetical protein